MGLARKTTTLVRHDAHVRLAMRTGAHRIAALVGGTGALLFAFMPWNLGLICGAVLGMMAGAEVERRQSLRVREETTEDAMTTGETR